MLQVFERFFNKTYRKLFDVVKWFYTFFAVNVLWLLFRSDSIGQWSYLMKKLLKFQDMSVSEELIDIFVLPENKLIFDIFNLNYFNAKVRGFPMLLFVITAFILCLVFENNYRNRERLNTANLFMGVFAFIWAFMCLSSESLFVYYGF